MAKLIDLTGQRFGKLVAEKLASPDGKYTRWWCVCECGNKVPVFSIRLRNGATTSCGCYRKQWSDAHNKRRALQLERSKAQVKKYGLGRWLLPPSWKGNK